MSPPPQAFFLGSGQARRFCVVWKPPPEVPARGSLLFVPPFAEEMNKSRRMVALAARALAQCGFTVMRVDLHGCGDSAGRLRDSSWSLWQEDIVRAARWLDGRGDGPRRLWSLRAGALLAAAAAPLSGIDRHLLWQPVLSGMQHLVQFLRMRVAADAFSIADPAQRSTQKQLLAQLQAGQSVAVAGYELPAAIALPLNAATLDTPPPGGAIWLEVASDDPPGLAPAAAARVGQWQANGAHIQARAVCGPAFWQTQEIEDCPALVAATTDLLVAPR